MKPRGKPLWLAAGLCVWMAAIVGASVLLWRYSAAPGTAAEAPSRIPAEFRSHARPHEFTLLMAVHPRCPCSRASLAELAKILTHSPDDCRTVVLAFKPSDEPDSWIETDLCRHARKLGAEVQIDEDGRHALAMGMQTSGQVLLYDPRGDLRYQGGVTSARGHQGDNLGQRTVERILNGEAVPLAILPVYGCPILADSCTIPG